MEQERFDEFPCCQRDWNTDGQSDCQRQTSPKTIQTTGPRRAPSAIRIAISPVRRETL